MLGTQIHLYSNTFIKTFQLSQFRFNIGFANKVQKLNMFTGKLGDYTIICYNTYGNILCPNPAEMNYKELADRTSFFKEQEKGVSSVCEIMEELMARGRQEGRKKGLTEGRTEERRHNILRMLSKGKSTAEIADLLDIPLHEVESLARGKSA